jgi:ABC-type bacteriocin/lantibiotic exporters, contain an N-terminal double-glycine peptidase domain
MNELKGTLLIKNIEEAFVKQNNQSWCGLACLSILCRYYGGDMPQEKLVKLSGTNVSGTTLLGLIRRQTQ